MNKLGKFIIVITMGLILSGCIPRDPSRYDVKSPCVSNDLDGNAPCTRRIPVENQIA